MNLRVCRGKPWPICCCLDALGGKQQDREAGFRLTAFAKSSALREPRYCLVGAGGLVLFLMRINQALAKSIERGSVFTDSNATFASSYLPATK